MPTGAMTLAWRPFLEPLDLQRAWFILLLPLAVGISVVYKAVRLHSMDHYLKEVGIMTVQVVVGMLALAVGFYLLVEVYVKWMAGRGG